jgi:SecD/SecF fusion protein
MKTWLQSILIGVIIATGMYFITEKKATKKYDIEYVVAAAPSMNSKIIDVLKKRLETAGWRHEIKQMDNSRAAITIYNINDTATARYALTAIGKLQFRDVYTANQLLPMLTELAKLSQVPASPPKNKKIGGTEKRDSMSKEVNALLDSIESSERIADQVFYEMIRFTSPYDAGSGITYPAEIGHVKKKDTTAFMKLLLDPVVKGFLPANARLYFGESIAKNKRSPGDELLPFYFINTLNDPDKALLENADIKYARQDFDQYGKVIINLEFTPVGAKKWAKMTRENIGRPIAMIFDKIVVSAPNVLSEIPDGNSIISGDYSVQEAREMELLLRSSALTDKLEIISERLKAKSGLTGQKLLVILISFLLATLIALFLFKTLRPTPDRAAGKA